jgi:type I restriction enzyme M protein
MTQLTQRELESYLWGAATLLRGLVDASDYKQYIFPLMFFKRLSDVWDGDYQQALDETGDEGYATDTANDRFVIPGGARWNDVRAAPRDVGRALLSAFLANDGMSSSFSRSAARSSASKNFAAVTALAASSALACIAP